MNRSKKILENIQQSISLEKNENQTLQDFERYKQSYYEMSVGSLRSILDNAKHILENLNNETIGNNLTAPHLQGMIAVVEDQMRSIHDFVMYVSENDDSQGKESKPGLWENIRKKKEREGKNYRPAKPGDKDRPDTEQWKDLTKKDK